MVWTDGFDYAIVVSASVKNVGKSGSVTVEGLIGTSEGNFKNTRTVVINEGQFRTVDFVFAQPSISVTPESVDVSFKCI